ncbi:hypothetical protein O9X98_10800 [Agrobacterium salinitolerans]|nr:hypothetical protein [Agrobacterium salinitolerans]
MATALDRLKDRWNNTALPILIIGTLAISPAIETMKWASKALVDAVTPEVIEGQAMVGAGDGRAIQKIGDRVATLSAGVSAIERKVLGAPDQERKQLARDVDAMFEAYMMAEGYTSMEKYDRVMLQAEPNADSAILDAVAWINDRKARMVATAMDLKTLAAAVAINDAEMAETAVASMRRRNADGGRLVSSADEEFQKRIVEYGAKAAEEIGTANEWREKSAPLGLARVLP